MTAAVLQLRRPVWPARGNAQNCLREFEGDSSRPRLYSVHYVESCGSCPSHRTHLPDDSDEWELQPQGTRWRVLCIVVGLGGDGTGCGLAWATSLCWGHGCIDSPKLADWAGRNINVKKEGKSIEMQEKK